ncbi:MAG: redoxin domain-containing protein [Proteobacteria bacterium]|nr:redoxin domain-containing protein [Pseudomonadota bacterium]MBU0968517.1 redoxin domain-containing protein [Pseudomonadota bacterium]
MAALAVLLLLSGCESNQRKSSLKIGDRAPDFTATDLEGEKISLHEWRGHPVVLRFWSTDCIYCRADTPIFNEYFDKYKDMGLMVVYLNSGASQEEVARFVSDLAIPFPVVMDKDGAVAALYRVRIVPQTIIIGPEQKINAAVPGGVGEAELQKLLAKYFVNGGKR